MISPFFKRAWTIHTTLVGPLCRKSISYEQTAFYKNSSNMTWTTFEMWKFWKTWQAMWLSGLKIRTLCWTKNISYPERMYGHGVRVREWSAIPSMSWLGTRLANAEGRLSPPPCGKHVAWFSKWQACQALRMEHRKQSLWTCGWDSADLCSSKQTLE